MITVKEVRSKKDLETFVKFPFSLYKTSDKWVPPLIQEELSTLDAAKNPIYREAESRLFLAYRDQKVAGRIAAIINHTEVDQLGKKKLRFGWFESINDKEVAEELFRHAMNFGKEKGLSYIEGPSGFSNMDKAGMLIEGFDRIGSMSTHYNFSYYPELMEKLGFEKEVDWKEYQIPVPEEVPEKVRTFSKLIQKKFGLKLQKFKSTKELLPWSEAIFELMNLSYGQLESFTPIKPYMVEHYKKKFLKFLDPDFVALITDQNDNLLGFSVVMPSFSKALQKANGKLFPFGFYHLWKAQKKNDKGTLLLIGIHPEWMRKGLTALIFEEVTDTFLRRGIKYVETNPELETNIQVQALWKEYGPELIKKWRTYKKEL
ncbi:GNAT family N-acetyltransferase [Robertkochia aurantiaca]|uniref:GNAT family N-acetyltransferase n=1 Tax=Robertkochia aurantiaca TaxID=2873700 RepID=UPI001CCE260D|nr:GNAT family N-acetyltransferase [Robertkochia sp. 3YJGBD-33]